MATEKYCYCGTTEWVCDADIPDRNLYMMEQGMAQHRGRQTGTIAAPPLLLLFDLDSASYAYFPPPRAQPP